MNRIELKERARAQIKGKIGILFLITAIMLVISAGGYFILSYYFEFGASIVSFIIGPAFSLSLIRVYINVALGNVIKVEDSLSGFDDFWSAFKLYFLICFFTYLWTLLFIIPGIIKSISYSMSMCILAENKGKSALQCINESKKMTEGHKKEIFVLALSFMGWYLLGSLTFGIGYIWIMPYIYTTYINAYFSLKSTEQNGAERKFYMPEI